MMPRSPTWMYPMAKHRSFPALSLLIAPALTLSLGACGAKSSTTGSGSGTDSGTMGSGGSAGQTSTSGGSTGGASAGSSTGNSFLATDTGASTGPLPPQPNGAQCGSDAECESEKCFLIPMLGGVCSECLTDNDCASGTCSFDQTLGYAACSDGGLGAMCSTPGEQGGCSDGLLCAELLDTMGFFPANYCSECIADTDCTNGQLCNPIYDTANGSGMFVCVDAGSVENDNGCDLGGSGDMACMSGYCGAVDFMGFFQLGVCGACDPDTNDGCMMGQTCTAGTADMSGLMGASCG